MPPRALPPLAAFVAGALAVAGFAPVGWFALPVIALALLIALCRRAGSPRAAAGLGFAFGLGLFLAGVSWVYVSMHDFGAMPAWLAALLTLVLCTYLALFPAAAAGACHALGARGGGALLAAFPALWTLTEWLRGWLFTGFPWLALGYAQVPAGPLAGLLPVFGVYGATFATAASAVLLCLAAERARAGARWHERLARCVGGPWLTALVALWAGSAALSLATWTEPAGAPIRVALVQGNIAQDLKWREDRVRATLDSYRELVASADAQLTVLPETALPLFLHQVPPDYLAELATLARRGGGDVLLGVPERGDARTYYNSAIVPGGAPDRVYRKSHLVPFGEFIPAKPLFGWFLDVMQIPLADFARGDAAQRPLAAAGQRIAVNICYEDAFGAEIARQLPEATLLVNLSNVAWFGRSIAPRQHLQISQARALETGRMMLRATNTGMTAIIDARGGLRAVAPEFTTAVVRGEVQGYAGATPYVRWTDAPVIAGALVVALALLWRRRRNP